MAPLNPIKKDLNELADKLGKRHDGLLDRLENLLQNDPEAAKIMLDELKRSLKSERLMRVLTILVLIIIITLGALYTINPFDMFKKDTRDLIHDLAMREDKPDYEVKMDSLTGRVHAVFQNSSLGIIDKLGRDETLLLKAEKAAKYLWSVGIKNSNNADVDEIGRIQFHYSRGELSDKTQGEVPYSLNEKIVYDGLDFVCKIKKTGEIIEGDSTRAIYSVEFGEQNVNGDVKSWSAPEKIVKSDNGRILSNPLLLWNPEWSAIYIVSIGVGKATKEDPNTIYKINSLAHAFRYR